MLFGRGQHALKADHEEIAEQMGANVLRSPAHVVLLEAANAFTNCGFDFSLSSHGDPVYRRVIQAKVLIGCQTWAIRYSTAIFVIYTTKWGGKAKVLLYSQVSGVRF
jgi:hypothetical protein